MGMGLQGLRPSPGYRYRCEDWALHVEEPGVEAPLHALVLAPHADGLIDAQVREECGEGEEVHEGVI